MHTDLLGASQRSESCSRARVHTDLPGALEAGSLLEASGTCKKSQPAGPQKASGSLRKPREASKKKPLVKLLCPLDAKTKKFSSLREMLQKSI